MRLLGPGDEAVLALLNTEDADFDLEGRGGPGRPLAAADAAAYLADPAVRHWVAEEDGRVVGFNLCYVLRRRNDDPREVLLFEIGVRQDARRRGAGRAMVEAMRAFMEREGIDVAWVLADNPGAIAFYAACGFVRDEEQGTQMLLTVLTRRAGGPRWTMSFPVPGTSRHPRAPRQAVREAATSFRVRRHLHSSTKPARTAIATASARVCAPNFSSRFWTCDLIVSLLSTSRSAMSAVW